MIEAPRKATTLAELLVVVAIASLVISLLLPAIQRIRSRSERLACQNSLRQIGIAMHTSQASQGLLIPLPNSQTAISPPGFPGVLIDRVSWMTRILPFIEGDSVYASAFSQSKDISKNPPHSAKTRVIKAYTCSADDRLREALEDYRGERFAYTSYVGISGFFRDGMNHKGLFSMRRASISLVHDGAGNTVMVGERPPADKPWGGWWYSGADMDGYCRGPNTVINLGPLRFLLNDCDSCALPSHGIGPGRLDNSCDRYHLWSLHGGGANFLFVDGSVRFMKYSSDQILEKLVSVNGGEPVKLED